MQLDDADKALLTPDEIAALTGSEADAHLEQMGNPIDDAGDGEGKEAAAPAAPAAAPAAAEGAALAPATAADGDSLTDEAAAAALAELDDKPAPAPTQAPAPPIPVEAKDFAADRTALKGKKDALRKEFTEGTIDDDAFFTRSAELDDQLLALATAQAKASTISEINAHNRQVAQARIEADEASAVSAVIESAKKEGTIDYRADSEACTLYDSVFDALKAAKANAGKPLAEITAKAHDAVLAMRGIQKPAPTPTPPPPPAQTPTARRDVPPSLSGLPNASPSVMNDDVIEQYSRLSGPAADDFLARLPAAQQQRLMSWADNAGLH